jgi:hypothetical protein
MKSSMTENGQKELPLYLSGKPRDLLAAGRDSTCLAAVRYGRLKTFINI